MYKQGPISAARESFGKSTNISRKIDESFCHIHSSV